MRPYRLIVFGRCRQRRWAALLAAFVVCGGVSLASAQDATLEFPIKATFLQKFADFVTWPGDAPAASFDVCVYGRDPFGPLLDNTTRGHAVGGREMAVRRINTIGEAQGCRIVYLGKTAQPTREILDALRGSHILTVTDELSSTARGMIHFVIDKNRVRFAIDDGAAEADHLEISAKLLAIAVSVSPAAKGGPS